MAQIDVIKKIFDVSNFSIDRIRSHKNIEVKLHEALNGINSVLAICSGAMLMDREEVRIEIAEKEKEIH